VGDVFDLLRPVRAAGSADAHLAPFDWAETPEDTTLCGLGIEGGGTEDFHASACLRCAYRAIGAGIFAVRDGVAVVNLSRLIDSRMPD
jgi:hypothetical protein